MPLMSVTLTRAVSLLGEPENMCYRNSHVHGVKFGMCVTVMFIRDDTYMYYSTLFVDLYHEHLIEKRQASGITLRPS